MEMKRIRSGKLCAAGYDQKTRVLRVELEDGRLLDYAGVGEEVWRRLSSSAAAWSYYRDNVEEEFPASPAGRAPTKGKGSPGDLFGP